MPPTSGAFNISLEQVDHQCLQTPMKWVQSHKRFLPSTKMYSARKRYSSHYAKEQFYSVNKAPLGKLAETSFMKYFLKSERLVARIAVISSLLMVVSTSAFASCYTNARGRVVCNNGEQAGGYNANTGTAWKSERNSNGVA